MMTTEGANGSSLTLDDLRRARELLNRNNVRPSTFTGVYDQIPIFTNENVVGVRTFTYAYGEIRDSWLSRDVILPDILNTEVSASSDKALLQSQAELVTLLGDEKYLEYKEHGYVSVKSPKGKSVKLYAKYSNNIDYDGTLYCAAVGGQGQEDFIPFPSPDIILILYRWLMHDEKGLLKQAKKVERLPYVQVSLSPTIYEIMNRERHAPL